VNPNGLTGCAKTIGAALAAAGPGDSINVAAGTYKESIAIGQPVILVGADPATTIIDALGLPVGISVDGLNNPKLSGVAISGFTIQNARFEGIVVTNASNVTIAGNFVTGNNLGLFFENGSLSCPGIAAWETAEDSDCGSAIHLSGVDHSSILNNAVEGNAGGILLTDETGATHDNLVAGNVISENLSGGGITLASHPPVTTTGGSASFGVYANSITSNKSSDNGFAGFGAGISLLGSLAGARVSGNKVVNNVVTGNTLPGILVHGSTPGQSLDGNLLVGNAVGGNGPDAPGAVIPGKTAVAFSSASPVAGTLLLLNALEREDVGVAWTGAGEVKVERNTLATTFGAYNAGPGTMTADNNSWNCAANPTFPISVLIGCSSTRGPVTVNTWMPPPPAAGSPVVPAGGVPVVVAGPVPNAALCPAGTTPVYVNFSRLDDGFNCVRQVNTLPSCSAIGCVYGGVQLTYVACGIPCK
jgi:hypothetical protein